MSLRPAVVTLRRRRAARSRQCSPPADEPVVEGAPDLAPSAAARERLVQAFVDLYVDVLLGALARQARGASPLEAVRAALAAAETRMARC